MGGLFYASERVSVSELERLAAQCLEEAEEASERKATQSAQDRDDFGVGCTGVHALVELDALGLCLPVCQASPEAPDWYLSHDPLGRASVVGVPFMDDRCGAQSAQVIVYGHRLAGTDAMFTRLAPCWRQEEFDRLQGKCLKWTTTQGTEELAPLCALKLHEDDREIQELGMRGPDELRDWLMGQCRRADALATGWQGLAATAERDIVLVTCNASFSGAPWRTVVIFVGTRKS